MIFVVKVFKAFSQDGVQRPLMLRTLPRRTSWRRSVMMIGSPWSTSTGAPSSGTVATTRRTGTCLTARFTGGCVWYGERSWRLSHSSTVVDVPVIMLVLARRAGAEAVHRWCVGFWYREQWRCFRLRFLTAWWPCPRSLQEMRALLSH